MAVQQRIVGDAAVDAKYTNAPADEQHIQRALSGNCFRDYVARLGIDLLTPELLTLAMLVSLGGCDSQVGGHVRGNLDVRNTHTAMLDVRTLALPGDMARLREHTDPDTSAGMIHDPHAATLTVVCEITHPAFVLLDPGQHERRVSSWRRVLATCFGRYDFAARPIRP